jgi:hypothetical protein
MGICRKNKNGDPLVDYQRDVIDPDTLEKKDYPNMCCSE